MKNDESTPYEKAGKKLRGARKSVGMTQHDLAEILSLSTRWIRDVERGKRYAGHKTQLSIHKLLSIDLYGKLGEIVDEVNQTPDISTVVPSSTSAAEQPIRELPALSIPPIRDERFRFKRKPPVSPNNPFVVMCRGCGENEYVRREYCRCGEYLQGQVQDHLSNWEAIARPELKRRVFNLYCLIFLGVIVALSPFAYAALFVAGGADGSFPQYVIENLYEIAPGVPIFVVLVLSVVMWLDRKRDRLEKLRRNLSYEHFVQSAYFRSLKRPA